MTKISSNDLNNFCHDSNELAEMANTKEAIDFWERGIIWSKRALIISTSIGVLIVTLYFLRIHYLPIDSLSSMASLGGIMALLAFALLASFVVLWGAPTITVQFIQSTSTWVSISHKFWKRKTNYYSNSSDSISFGRVVLFVTLAIGIPWPFLLISSIENFIVPSEFQLITSIFLVLFWFFGLIWFSFEKRAPVSEVGPLNLDTSWRGHLVRGAWFIAFTFSGVYPLLAFAQMTAMTSLDIPEESYGWLWILLGGLGAVIALHSVNLFIELSKSTNNRSFTWKSQIGSTVACIFLVLTLLSATTKIHDVLMWGISVRVPHAHVVVKKSACDALRLAGINASRYSALPGETAMDSCILLDVTVLSKLGTQWRIACARDSAVTNNYRGFNIDANDVITLIDANRADKIYSAENDICLSMWAP